MKKIALICVCLFLFGVPTFAQTASDLIGKWHLVEWDKNGKKQDIVKFFKTDQVYQVFMEKGKFRSIVGDETYKGKWKLLKDGKELRISSGLPSYFKIDYLDDKNRTISSDEMGTFKYVKVEE